MESSSRTHGSPFARLARRAALCAIPVALSALGVTAIVTACGDASNANDNDASDLVEAATPAPSAACPRSLSTDETTCALPEGTTCSFDACGTRIAKCTRGRWVFGDNPSPVVTCPAVPPEVDASCPPCWPKDAMCTYGSTDCTSPDASLNTATASCPNGAWAIEIRPCRDGGGSDVQGDASSDAGAR